jgi:hypothetical protein
VYLPTIGEANHLDMVPTASSYHFPSFLQAVAVQVASERELTAVDFVGTHPKWHPG